VAAFAVVGVAVVGRRVVVDAVAVVAGDRVCIENMAETVRTPPALKVIVAEMVCRPVAGDHGLAVPSAAVPLKSKGR
jgi:hypothetical protein